MSQYDFECECRPGVVATIKEAYGALIAECGFCGERTPPRQFKGELSILWVAARDERIRASAIDLISRKQLEAGPTPEPTEPEPPECVTCYYRGAAVEYPNVLCHAINGKGNGEPVDKDGWCPLHPLATPWLEWRYARHLKERVDSDS